MHERVCESGQLCVSVFVYVSVYVSLCVHTPPLRVCMYVFMAAQQAGLAGATCVYLCVYVCVCVRVCVFVCVWENETDIKRERLWGQAREQLHSEEEFCSADDYTCRADATPAAGALTAKVTEPGWHREGPRGTGRECARTSVCLCVRWCWMRDVVGCRAKQLSGNGNSKGHCCLSILCITPSHIHKN